MRHLSLSSINQRKSKNREEIIKLPIVKYLIKVYIYRYFSKKEFRNIYCFIDNLNTELLYTIYKTTLLSSIRNFFGRNNHS